MHTFHVYPSKSFHECIGACNAALVEVQNKTRPHAARPAPPQSTPTPTEASLRFPFNYTRSDDFRKESNSGPSPMAAGIWRQVTCDYIACRIPANRNLALAPHHS